MSPWASQDKNRSASPVSPSSSFPPAQSLNMSQHIRRFSGRLQPIAPSLHPGPAGQEERKSKMSIEINAEIDTGVTTRTTKSTAKRAQVTSVACHHCQKQKSKCDGIRPMCGPCGKRGRKDCTYELPRDQRRSTFMRERIEELNREKAELKDIIRGIALAEDRETAVETARMLVVAEFENVQEVAQLMRSESFPTFATLGCRRSIGDLELQSLQTSDRTTSMALPQNMSFSPHGLQNATAISDQDYLPYQLTNDSYVPPAAPSSPREYWNSSLASPFSAVDQDVPSWPPPLPEG